MILYANPAVGSATVIGWFLACSGPDGAPPSRHTDLA